MTTQANATKSAKANYEEALSAQNLIPGSKNLSEAVLNILLSNRVPSSYTNLTKQIAEAASKGEIDTVLKLSNDLKNVQDNERQNKKSLEELRKKYSLADVLQAFAPEFEEVAYEVAVKTLSTTHALITEASKKKGSRTPKAAGEGAEGGEGRKNKQSVFKITKKDGTVVDLPILQGPKGNIEFKKAEAEYNALGYTVKVEGKEQFVEPSTIVLKDGSEIPVNRSNLIEAIEKQTSAQFDGWKVEKVKVD
ncbi:hypothetical protein JE006_22980 [Pseudomonas aeruginosa]|nr:hypothetical protein [Pseudomonas aeruginosa]HEJ1837310.1 hypothetical protein [Pseudomonas aeruginosa]HEK3577563.1 hypothetical protein [Pseudomonas aeruginosa]HEK3590452.1 hypothetical protein [Pseudomonas aeruginosa]